MHGRVKVRTTAEQEAIKKKERAEKAKKIRAYNSIIFEKRKDKIYDEELMLLTQRILLENADSYTLWNIRREAFTTCNWSEDVMEENHKKELMLIENCLRNNPKSYHVWHQRSWIMDRMKEPDWKRELALCAQCLNRDERNFHCWDYRQFVVERAGISDSEEFDFSTTKILNNFSNYSSWHYRSRILARMSKNEPDEEKVNEKLKEELDLVMNATFTDPGDSSAWFYQRWLLDSGDRSVHVERALFTGSTVILAFNKNANAVPPALSTVEGKKFEVDWTSNRGQKYSTLWVGKIGLTKNGLTQDPPNPPILMGNYKLTWCEDRKGYIYKAPRGDAKPYYNEEQLREQLSSYQQLSEMEPNNKWAPLTGMILMRKIDPIKYQEDVLLKLKALQKVDPLRGNYYQDLRSRYIIEHALDSLWSKEADLELAVAMNLSDLGLTTLRKEQYFAFFEEVNLAGNALGNALYLLSALKSCVKLSLSNNHLQSLKQFPTLPSLRFLSLRSNDLSDPEDVLCLVRRHKLTKLDLRNNPVYENETFKCGLAELAPDLELCTD